MQVADRDEPLRHRPRSGIGASVQPVAAAAERGDGAGATSRGVGARVAATTLAGAMLASGQRNSGDERTAWLVCTL